MFNLPSYPLHTKRFIGLGLLISVLSRIIPHPPNMTAVTAFSLLAGAHLTKSVAISIIVANVLLSDLLLSLFHGYAAIGPWTVFTLTGHLIAVYVGQRLIHQGAWLEASLLSSIGFWLWSNLGVWLTTTLYSSTLTGLFACYTAALPFLVLSIFGDLLWLAVLVYGFARAAPPLPH